MTTLIVPNSFATIGSLAFNEDPSLTAIYFRGNAPSVQPFGFRIPNTVIVYYLPGTSGRTTNLGGLPTVLCQPKVLMRDGNFGVRTNQFGFNFSWASGMSVIVDACTDLVNPK